MGNRKHKRLQCTGRAWITNAFIEDGKFGFQTTGTQHAIVKLTKTSLILHRVHLKFLEITSIH